MHEKTQLTRVGDRDRRTFKFASVTSTEISCCEHGSKYAANLLLNHAIRFYSVRSLKSGGIKKARRKPCNGSHCLAMRSGQGRVRTADTWIFSPGYSCTFYRKTATRIIVAANMQQKFLTKHVLAVKGLKRIASLLENNAIPDIPEAILAWLGSTVCETSYRTFLNV